MLVNAPQRSICTFLFAHGAGAPMDSPFMTTFAEGLAARGVRVVRFEFDYMARRRLEGRKLPPDRMPALMARFLAVAASLPKRGPLFIGGKSMGSRVAAHVADTLRSERAVHGVVALGYPFHPPRQPAKLRLDVLQTVATPCLIVQGTRDPLGNQTEVIGYTLPDHLTVHWIADGDHSFVPRRASGRSEAKNLTEAIDCVASFMRQTTRTAGRPRTPRPGRAR